MGLITVTLDGHLTRDKLVVALARAAVGIKLAATPPHVVIDCRTMTGYDSDARDEFVAWNSKHRGRMDTMLVVTPNKLWHMVIRVMALASKQHMIPFDTLEAAVAWTDAQV